MIFRGRVLSEAQKTLLIFLFSFFKTLFVLRNEETVINWVGYEGFDFYVVLGGYFFTSEFEGWYVKSGLLAVNWSISKNSID